MSDVRLLTPGDLEPASSALGRAFADDPAFEFLTPNLEPAERAPRIARFFRAEARQRARLASVWTSYPMWREVP